MNALRRALVAIAAGALLLAAGSPVSASAAPQDGWVRLAHMSPDTAAVNATLSSLTGDVTLFRLTDVGYGAVSKYMRLPAGTYALAMVPAGNDDPDATPVVSGSVTVRAGKAETVAAIGRNADLQTKTFSDDLAAVSGGDAKVRIMQASVTHPEVDVSDGSKTIAEDAAFGTVSDYATVDAGSTDLRLTAAADSTTAGQKLVAGSSTTVFVIDDAKGRLTTATALDSAAATETPVGSLAAGGGALASSGATAAGWLALAAALGAAVAAALLVGRRREALRS